MYFRVSKHGGKYKLEFDVFSINQKYIYTMFLCFLNSNETNLYEKEGRFYNFDVDPQKYKISLEIKNDNFEMLLNWIAEHVNDLWNVSINMSDVSKGEYIFSFKDPVSAVLFALVWK